MLPVRILVVTSTKGFGQLIQQTLQESSRYIVTLVESVNDAIYCIKQDYYNLSIIDAVVRGGSIEYLAQILRTLQPGLKLIIIPPDNNPTVQIMTTLAPDGYLTKPFYLPDLFDTIEEALGVNLTPDESHQETSSRRRLDEMDIRSLDWVDDTDLATQHLTHLTKKTAARAALILREERLWVYAGHISKRSVEELASIVINLWQGDAENLKPSGDKIRQIRLKSTADEYLIYVMALVNRMVLALAFEPQVPLSEIRAQSAKLARALVSPTDHIIEMALNDLSTQRQQVHGGRQNSRRTPPDATAPNNNLSAYDENAARVSFMQEKNRIAGRSTLSESTNMDEMGSNPFNIKGRSGSTRTAQAVVHRLSIDDFRPVTPAIHYLNFACLLIPRIPTHHLIGELASSLSAWLGQLCLAYGWRLEHQSIRPAYLLWVAHVSPTTSPSFHIRMIRKQTSQRIFDSFSHFRKDNPSRDFWAPGYLIVSSTQPPTADIINQYIYQTRYHQGA